MEKTTWHNENVDEDLTRRDSTYLNDKFLVEDDSAEFEPWPWLPQIAQADPLIVLTFVTPWF